MAAEVSLNLVGYIPANTFSTILEAMPPGLWIEGSITNYGDRDMVDLETERMKINQAQTVLAMFKEMTGD